MTAYRSFNDYRQPTLRYDGIFAVSVTVSLPVIAGTSSVPAVSVATGTGVTATPAVIAGTSSVPAVTVSEGTGVTVAPAVIAATASTPAATVEIITLVAVDTVAATAALPSVTVTEGSGVTVSLTTVSSSGLIPDVTVTEGAGVTATGIIAALAAFPALTVTEGSGVSVTFGTVACWVTVHDPGLQTRIIMVADSPGALLDVLPYHVVSPQRRWKSRFAAPARTSKNIYILTDNTITNRHPVDRSTISRQILGGHESPTDLSSEEQTLLIDAGYAFEVV